MVRLRWKVVEAVTADAIEVVVAVQAAEVVGVVEVKGGSGGGVAAAQ